MKIACVILGTRGDVQPMIALAVGLNALEHEATVYAPVENQELALKHDCPFVPFGPEIKKSIEENPEKQKGGVAVKMSPKKGKVIMLDQIERLPALIREADLLLGVGLVMGVHTAADILKAKYRLVAFYPIILGTTKDDPLKNRMMFGMGKLMMNLMMKGYINKARKTHGLEPIKDIWTDWLGENVILACDKELNAARENSQFPFTQTAFMLLPSKTELPAEVNDFINAGKPPVYIGFGSNPITDTQKYSAMFEQVRETTGERLIISKGWAGFAPNNSTDILYVDDLPFEKLFPKMAAAVYHGGTGTMAAIVRAGIPQAAFPFMGDQFDNRNQIVKLGLGPDTCDFKEISSEAISKAIKECVSVDNFKKNAVQLSQKLKAVNGVEMTVQLIEKEMLK